jgi:protein-tyrosine phosphatase
VIDLHTHLLPGVDDGARSSAQAVAVLARFAEDGVTRVACTPHLRASDVRVGEVPDLSAAHARLAESCRAAVRAVPVVLRGWEIMLDDPGVELAAAELGLGGGPAVLVELPRGEIPPGIERELTRLRASGVVPIVAHPERYAGLTIVRARRWREAGAALQGDATTLCGSGTRGAVARALLADGAYDILASDNHGDARALAAARDFLTSHGAPDVAQLLTVENPRCLLDGSATEPVPPLRVADDLAARLRAWFAARLRAPRSSPS